MGAVKRTHRQSVINQKGARHAKKWLARLRITNEKGRRARVSLRLNKFGIDFKTEFKRNYPNGSHNECKVLRAFGLPYKPYRKMYRAFGIPDEVAAYIRSQPEWEAWSQAVLETARQIRSHMSKERESGNETV